MSFFRTLEKVHRNAMLIGLSDEKCSSDGKWSLGVLPFAFDSPFDAKAVYCS
jgi:hypothetical protein